MFYLHGEGEVHVYYFLQPEDHFRLQHPNSLLMFQRHRHQPFYVHEAQLL